jgi:hypothetical protein
MRPLQIMLFASGVVALVASAFGLGWNFGGALYKTGMGLLLIDIACLLLWPSSRERGRQEK